MMRSMLARMGTAVAAASVIALVAGCASNTGSATDASKVTTGMVGEQSDGGDPVEGGSLSFATFTGVSSLDPADRQDGGSTGGSEMAAIYDLLMRFNPETKGF